MFLLYQCQLIGNPLSIILLSLFFFNLTIILQGVNSVESNLPHAQGNKLKETINTTSNPLGRREMESLNSRKGKKVQMASMNENELVSTRSVTDMLKNNDPIDKEFYKNIKSNNSTDGWNDLLTNVNEEKDIICWYRKASDDTVIKTVDDWQKLLDIADGYKIYSVQNSGSKYLICLKKLNSTEIMKTQTLDRTELNPQKDKNRKSNKNINTNNNKNNFEEDCDEDVDEKNKSSKINDKDCVENNKSTMPVSENITTKYSGGTNYNKSNLLNQENFSEKNMNTDKSLNNLLRTENGYKKHYKPIHTNGYQQKHARKTIDQPSKSISISNSQKIYNNKKINKFNPFLKNFLKSQINNLNPSFYKKKTENSSNKRMIAIPFILYLHILKPLNDARLLNTLQNKNLLFLTIMKYNQLISSCKNKHLLPFGLLIPMGQFSYESPKISNQMYVSNTYQDHNNFPHIKPFSLVPNVSVQQENSKYLTISSSNDFNTPVDLNINEENLKKPILGQNKNDQTTSTTMTTNSNYEQLSDIKNVYQPNMENVNNDINYRILGEDVKNSNDITIKSATNVENSTQYLNLLNETVNRNMINNESTSQNNVTELTL